jgi:DNA-binding response OmpR family regulator
MRILIAEDDLSSRLLLAAILKKDGHEVVETVDGLKALEALREPDAPRLAILDWMMPQMDGVEVCRRIRSLPTDDPPYLILLTGRDDEGDITEGLAAGADDYLAKPYRKVELRARIAIGQRMLELQSGLKRAREALGSVP